MRVPWGLGGEGSFQPGEGRHLHTPPRLPPRTSGSSGVLQRPHTKAEEAEATAAVNLLQTETGTEEPDQQRWLSTSSCWDRLPAAAGSDRRAQEQRKNLENAFQSRYTALKPWSLRELIRSSATSAQKHPYQACSAGSLGRGGVSHQPSRCSGVSPASAPSHRLPLAKGRGLLLPTAMANACLLTA